MSPDTRDPDIVKIAKSDLEFRMYVMGALSRIEATLELHTKDDERRFQDLDKKYSGVSSSVDDISEDNSQDHGIRKAIGWALMGVVYVTGWLVAWFHK